MNDEGKSTKNDVLETGKQRQIREHKIEKEKCT
jgi:hypothetical protein